MLNRDGRWLIKVLQTARGVTLLSLAVHFQATSQRIAALTPTTVGSEDLQDAANADCIHGCRGPCRRGIWSQALADPTPVTGLSAQATDIVGKRLEFLQEPVPR